MVDLSKRKPLYRVLQRAFEQTNTSNAKRCFQTYDRPDNREKVGLIKGVPCGWIRRQLGHVVKFRLANPERLISALFPEKEV